MTEIVNLALGRSKIFRAHVHEFEWMSIILLTIKDMAPALPTFSMFKPITEPMNGHFTFPHSKWKVLRRKHGKERYELLDKSGWPDGVTRETKVIPLYEFPHNSRLGFGGVILLTDKGELFVWEWYGTDLWNHFEVLQNSKLVPFTTDEFRKHCRANLGLPYFLFDNICMLSQVETQIRKEMFEAAQTLATTLSLRQSMFTPI
jgi:hypothetical protein